MACLNTQCNAVIKTIKYPFNTCYQICLHLKQLERKYCLLMIPTLISYSRRSSITSQAKRCTRHRFSRQPSQQEHNNRPGVPPRTRKTLRHWLKIKLVDFKRSLGKNASIVDVVPCKDNFSAVLSYHIRVKQEGRQGLGKNPIK